LKFERRLRHRRRQEGAVKKGPVQNELTFREMVDGISALVAVLTPGGAVDFVNRQVLEYFGKTLEELKEWASTDAVHPDDLPRVIGVWTRSIESGQPYDVELRQRGADGVCRWFHVQGLPVRDADDRSSVGSDQRRQVQCSPLHRQGPNDA
jgi:PAS domain S-box-containing protein